MKKEVKTKKPAKKAKKKVKSQGFSPTGVRRNTFQQPRFNFGM
jgi:hypothetical protein